MCLLRKGWKEPYKWNISPFYVEFQVLMDVTVKSTVYSNMTPCTLVEIYGCFETISCLCLQGSRSARNVCKFLLVYDICLYSWPSVAVIATLSMYNISQKSAGPFRHSWLMDVVCLQIHMALAFLYFQRILSQLKSLLNEIKSMNCVEVIFIVSPCIFQFNSG